MLTRSTRRDLSLIVYATHTLPTTLTLDIEYLLIYLLIDWLACVFVARILVHDHIILVLICELPA